MDFSQFNYAYAISGGIGSGKSSVCKILSTLGYAVLDADKIAHQVLQRKTQEIISVFGEEILEEGKINRKALGSIVFANKEKLKTLENILNPSIYEEIFSQCQKLESRKKPYFLEIALLFEQRENLNFKHKILITAPKEVVLERVQSRDGLSIEAIKQRISSQLSVEEKIPFATQIIQNDSNLSGLEKKIKQWAESLG